MKETHPCRDYIFKNSEVPAVKGGFLPQNARTLIIGTFPPPKEIKRSKKGLFFYYQSPRNQFWNIIDSIKGTELKLNGLDKLSGRELENVLENNIAAKKDFCLKNNTAFIDIFTEIDRKHKDSSNDADLIPLKNILEEKILLRFLKKACRLIKILCKYRLAYYPLTKNLKLPEFKNYNYNPHTKSLIINGRELTIKLLYPPVRASCSGKERIKQYKNFIFEIF